MRHSYDKIGLRLNANFEDTKLWDTFYKYAEGSLQLWLKSKRKRKLKYDDRTRKADLRLNADSENYELRNSFVKAQKAVAI